MKVVSFNIRSEWNADGINSFIHRIGLIYEKINQEEPEIIGFQEMMDGHLDVMKKLFPKYEFLGCGRNKNLLGEGVYTAYRKDALIPVESKVFWLSDTPEVPESRFDFQRCTRHCIVNLFYHKASEKFLYVYNTHLDHYHLINKDADPKVDSRTKSAKLILKRLDADLSTKKCPAIFMGDFNSRPDAESVKLCKEYGLTDISEGIANTFHKYGTITDNCKIDYMFVTKDLVEIAKPAYIWENTKNGIYLSDHHPIATEIDF
ncbi:MAG: endonuclease/exonuclease/phosphatase family protein [Clostridiales bacterium]|nr:endonuclease/exonuclease/phosphatase family protein [Clostridiales bacterium]